VKDQQHLRRSLDGFWRNKAELAANERK
jgi:hypothetical protein